MAGGSGNLHHQTCLVLMPSHPLPCCFCFMLLQSSNPNVLLQWPHALHILGLIYNQQL